MSFQLGMRIPPHIGKQGIEKVAAFAAEVGLDVLDVPALTPEIKQACESAGLGIGSVDAAGIGRLLSKDESRRIEAAEALKKQIAEIGALGGTVLFVCLVPEDRTVPRRETFAIWKDVFPEIVRQAEQSGVYIAIEGWPGPGPEYPTIGCTPEMWRAMFEAVPSAHFGLNYDPSHLVRLGIDYLRALEEFGERVNHAHGKDTEILLNEQYEFGTLPATFGVNYGFSEGAWRYTIPGHGEVDWKRVAVRLERFGYKGAISIELEDHRFWGSLEKEQEGIIKSTHYLAEAFK